VGKHLLIVSLIFAALTAGCSSTKAPVAAAEPAALPLNSFMRKWAVDIDPAANGIAQLYVREDLIFAYGNNGSVYVIQRDNGRMLHADPIPGGLTNLHPPVLYKDRIVYPQLNGLQIFDRKTGAFQRTVHLSLAIRSNAVGTPGELFFGADFPGGGRLINLDMTRDYYPVRWGLMFPDAAVSAAPAVLGDVVYSASEDGKVTAVAIDNRDPVWSFGFFETSGPVYGDLQVDESGLYVACNDSKLYCINRASGKVKWQYFAGVGLKATPAVTRELVLEAVPGVGLVALDKAPPVVDGSKGPQYDRTPRWTIATGTQFLAEDTHYIYIATVDQRIAAIDKKSGQAAFTSKENGFTAWGINHTDAVIFAATPENQVIAVQTVPVSGTIGEIVRADKSGLDAVALARASN
jgi:outer membrane protein assembly factor BamB